MIGEWQNLAFGSQGIVVQKLQQYLNELMKLNPPLPLDGVFDEGMSKAVRDFQRKNKIPVNHFPVVSLHTWKAIGDQIGQIQIFNDPDLPPALKRWMARDVIANPGGLRLDKTSFKLLFRLRFPHHAGKLVDANLDRLLGFMEADANVSDLRWFAYMLATVLWECGADFLPRAEGGCDDTTGCTPVVQTIGGVRTVNNRTYGSPMPCPSPPCPAGKTSHTYYGRGYVQITLRDNYRDVGRAAGVGDTLVHFPERALEPNLSYLIMSVGMRDGLFVAGNSLSKFIFGTKSDYEGARNIVNPGDTDSIRPIAEFALKFEEMLAGCTMVA